MSDKDKIVALKAQLAALEAKNRVPELYVWNGNVMVKNVVSSWKGISFRKALACAQQAKAILALADEAAKLEAQEAATKA
jgi:hypothetical protein